ncbi:hypothetical protein GBA52_015324 [Prunus armeniaca]|nr:hypothetical protein GBA52_015324 [Prunus armeniaca]
MLPSCPTFTLYLLNAFLTSLLSFAPRVICLIFPSFSSKVIFHSETDMEILHFRVLSKYLYQKEAPIRVSREELECRSLARDAPFFYSLIINPSFLLSAHSFQASIKVKAGRRRNSRRKGRETEARLTSSFPFCSRCGLRFLPSQRYPPMQERQLLCSQEEQIHAIPLFKFKQESILFSSG